MSGISLALAMLIANPVILGATPGPITGPETPADTVQAEMDLHARMTIDVAVHGLGPYRFLIDTGSQRTVVSTALAGKLGLAMGPQVRVVGIAGVHDVATAQIDSIDIGPRSFYDLTVPLLERQNMGADGILGTDSLQHQRVLLDFAHNTISIGDPKELGGRRDFEIIVQAKRRSGRLILTDAMIDGVRTDVVIDTGASGTVGNRALQRTLARKSRSQDRMTGTLASVTGQELPVDLAVAGKLELGHIGVANVLIAYADAPAFRELKLDKRPAIFLGMRELRAFKRIAIDFSTRKVLFDLVEPQ
ncbi:aspartyl protease family protein [Novosphingobium sp. P6W]|uniref:aspartyl protease family protein n=1 Tax=Novosphingobium sp. P6W TaxID=1609758 RepID=UPI0005C302C0|nr:retroviral-like aspartic protease family protein [Novosphingobium sp. P6W]AXB76062.1 peptidase A2 [Novosphingobium sp. P6W]KIS31245.1 peptidase A2 [Novosphingobium sp. P6W]